MTRRLPLLLGAGLVFGSLAAGCVSDVRSEDGPDDADPRGVATTLPDLLDRLEACRADVASARGGGSRRCTHIVYVWSSSMPLSELGFREIRKAAGATGTALSVMAAPELLAPTADPPTDSLRRALVAAGTTVHFPSLVVLQDGEPVGSAIVGYKRASAYEDLLRERLAAAARGDAARPAPLGPAGSVGGSVVTAGEPDIRVLWAHTVSPPPGAFFRRVPGTTFISFDQRGAVHLRDLASDETFRGPGWIDFVPTPDGRLFVTPGRGDAGLEFYDVDEVFARGRRAGGARDVPPLFTDGEMADQYPSAGVLEADSMRGLIRYRVLVSWFSGLAFRDYEVRWSEAGRPVVAPLTPKREGCPGMDLSTPIMSRDGREVAARDEETGTTKVFRLEDDGSCRELFDLGRQTSKVGFSDDGSLIAYSSPDPAFTGRGVRSTTWVLDRGDMRTSPVPHSASAGLVIPEVIGTDSLLIAVKEEARAGASEFRLLCCVGG